MRSHLKNFSLKWNKKPSFVFLYSWGSRSSPVGSQILRERPGGDQVTLLVAKKEELENKFSVPDLSHDKLLTYTWEMRWVQGPQLYCQNTRHGCLTCLHDHYSNENQFCTCLFTTRLRLWGQQKGWQNVLPILIPILLQSPIIKLDKIVRHITWLLYWQHRCTAVACKNGMDVQSFSPVK
jgi:hypothetical protein